MEEELRNVVRLKLLSKIKELHLIDCPDGLINKTC